MAKINMPSSCTCPECGSRIYFTKTVFANWDKEYELECVNCGTALTLFQGEAEVIRPEDDDEE